MLAAVIGLPVAAFSTVPSSAAPSCRRTSGATVSLPAVRVISCSGLATHSGCSSLLTKMLYVFRHQSAEVIAAVCFRPEIRVRRFDAHHDIRNRRALRAEHAPG